MKFILFELGFRGLYVVLLYTGITICFYLSAGFQYEYASVLCHSHYQSIDFCFNSLLLPYNNPHIYVDLISINSDEANFPFAESSFLYPTKSWAYVGISSVCYFHNCSVDPALHVWSIRVCILCFMLAFQCYAFALPGADRKIRLKWITAAHYGLLLLGLYIILTPAMLVAVTELRIEPFDSELIVF